MNRIQLQIFTQLGSQQQMEPDQYVAAFSMKYIGKTVNTLTDLSEEEADIWIHKAYEESLQ
ncbi:hypothetical protein [Desulfosediminicola flagellatus]|uniref:hypothetical protein n=1 Tax=Desulfosediminicola flagellatus TaxID=2569541 RepID=UPI0010ACE0E0|nr:hypothetical protein [Desulfosediminicola flagellatus]